MNKFDKVVKSFFMCVGFIGMASGILTDSITTILGSWFILWGLETYVKEKPNEL